MKILVTGAKGFIGKHLVNRLNIKHEVYAVGRDDLIPDKEYDVVINCAATIHSNEGYPYYRDNVEYVEYLLDVVNFDKFIQIGSSSEYGPINTPRHEYTDPRPSNLYEITKLIATNKVLDYPKLKRGGNMYVARPFCIYGPGQASNKFIPTVINRIKNNLDIDVYPGSHDYVYIDDFIDGLELLLASDPAVHIFNFGSGIATSNYEVAYNLKTLLCSNVKIKMFRKKYREYDVETWVADTNNTKNNLGWEFKTPLIEGLKLCLSI